VTIDDDLLTEVKFRAARNHCSIGDVIDDALRVAFNERADQHPRRIVLPTDGGSGLQPGVDLEDKDALAELLGDNAAPHAPG